jgi:hypothetical protein
VAHGFDAVSVGIEHERGVVAGMILGPQPCRAIVHPASRERGGMERAHSGSMGRSEADMGAARGLDRARLRRDCELDAVRMRNGAVIGPPAFEVEQTHQPQWTQRGIVEGAAAFQVGDTEGDMIEQCALLRFLSALFRMILCTRRRSQPPGGRRLGNTPEICL